MPPRATRSNSKRLFAWTCGLLCMLATLILWFRHAATSSFVDGQLLSPIATAPAPVVLLPGPYDTLQPSTPSTLTSDPVAVLKSYFAIHSDATHFSYPVGGQVHLASNNARGGSGSIPPLCGRPLLDALGFSLEVLREGWSHCGDDQESWCYQVDAVSRGHVFDEVTLSSRLVGRDVIVQGTTHRSGPNEFMVDFGPFSPLSMTDGGVVDVDVLLTWVGPFFVGQRWSLPDRNDDPPFLSKKAKCLDLSLSGSCDRFGVVVLNKKGLQWPIGGVRQVGSRDAPLCSAEQDIAANGAWRRIDADNSLEEHLLLDPVGLNTLQGTAWRWSANRCRVRLFSKSDALQCFEQKSIHSIGLFGDSMMVEFVRQLSVLFDVPVRQGKYKRLRYMELQVQRGGSAAVRIRFSRSYTTREGSSVIASPSTILAQLLATAPDVILGNAAVLHWQQNMMPLAKWEENLRQLRQLLTPPDSGRPWQRRVGQSMAFYLGPTLIHMGRTQGLEPTRTAAFASAAAAILSSCPRARNETACPRFRMFLPMNLSSSRREGAYDGQHWACYHTYGGISQMITQLWLNQLCNPTYLRGIFLF